MSNHILYDWSKSYGVSNESASNSESIDVCFERFLQKKSVWPDLPTYGVIHPDPTNGLTNQQTDGRTAFVATKNITSGVVREKENTV